MYNLRLQIVFFPHGYATHGSRTGRKKRSRLPREKQIRPRSSIKPSRQEIPSFCSATPGRRLPAIVAPFLACPLTAALRLALCPSLSLVSRVRPISWTVGGRQSLVGCCPVQFRFFAQLVCNSVGIWVAGTHRVLSFDCVFMI